MIRFAVFLLLVSCNQPGTNIYPLNCDKAIITEKISRKIIDERIRAKDSCYIIYVIKSLSDTTLTDCEFTDRAGSLAGRLDFMFCGYECEDSPKDEIFWTTLPKEKRMELRAIMAKAWLEYAQSCLFMSVASGYGMSNCGGHIDLMPFCKEQLLYDSLFLGKFRKSLIEVCIDCK